MTVHTKPEDSMGRPKTAPKTRNVKITEDAYDAARIASGFTGDTVVDFISATIKEHAERVIEEQYAARKARQKKEIAPES